MRAERQAPQWTRTTPRSLERWRQNRVSACPRGARVAGRGQAVSARVGSPGDGQTSDTRRIGAREALSVLVPVAVIGLALAWSRTVPIAPGTNPPADALLILAAITLITIVVVRWFQRGIDLDARAALALPLPLYTLFLAAVILAGTPGATILACIASLNTLLPVRRQAHLRQPAQRWREVTATLRETAIASATTLAAGAVYVSVFASPLFGNQSLHVRIIGGLGATLVIMVGVSLSRIMNRRPTAALRPQAWRTYLFSPAFRYQILLLSVGPLLPLVEILDDAEAELAWILFLVPLYAIYYLALVSVRLQQQTEELQRTIEALRAARQREAELTGYAALITQAQEEERRRLARELHDDTAQALVALSRGLDALATRQVDPPLPREDRRFLEELGSLAKRTLDGIRRACQNLRPSVLDDLGLAAALESLVTAMSAQGLRCAYTQTGEARPCKPEVEVTVYRIAQEALSNALRHARARLVTVELAYGASALSLVVQDDGCGFDPSAMLKAAQPMTSGDGRSGSTHLGLLGMRERAALIGASLDIKSTPNTGTRIAVQVPLPAPQSSRSVAVGASV
jgi:signal transduction histidine kinase